MHLGHTGTDKFLLHSIDQASRTERPLVTTVEVVTRANPKYLTVPFIEPDAVLDPGIRTMTTFQATIDDVCDDPESREPPCRPICSRWGPPPGDDVVAGWLGGLWGHPKP